MAAATWTFAVTTMPVPNVVYPAPGLASSGTMWKVIDYLDQPLDARYIRRRSDFNELELRVVNSQDVRVVDAGGYRSALLAFRNGVKIFHGQIVESRENADGYTLGARDPYFNLYSRRLRNDITYDNVGDALIAVDLINKMNAIRQTWLAQGTILSGPLRDRKWEFGDVAAEKIAEVRNLNGAFEFVINVTPESYTPSAGAVAAGDPHALMMATFNATTAYDLLREKAVFAYGDGTFANCLDFERNLRPLYNSGWVAYNAGDGAIEWADADALIQKVGLWEDQRGQVDTESETTAHEAAEHAVNTEIHYDISVIPGPDAPQLFTDFDVLDKVPVDLRRHGRTISKQLPVSRAVVSIDAESAHELLEEVVLLEREVLA